MCGIVGYLGNDDYKEYILSGLKLLQNRGYDSVGISIIDNNDLETTKFASSNTNDALYLLENEVNTKLKIGSSTNKNMMAIGHTRWATHGGKTDINAHPHHDNHDRIALVHNGIIENYNDIKVNLIKQGYFFRSQTDTEVIAVLIGKYLDYGETMENAIQKTVAELSGTWALVIIHRDYPNKIWMIRNGSPLLLGLDYDFIIIASEPIAFGNFCKTYIDLDNHDLIEITMTDNVISYNKNIQRYQLKEKPLGVIEMAPTNYDHWLIKEILEQPDAITRALNNGGRIESNVTVKLGGLDNCKQRLMDINHLLLLGCGTSYHAGLWAMDIFKQLDIFDTVSIYDGAEFQVRDIPKKGKTAVILLSQSGETKDLHQCIQIARDYDMITIGVVNVIDSLIARETDCGVYLNAGREVSVASTKSFTNQCIVLTMIAVWFSQNKGTHIEYRKKIISDLRNVSYQLTSMLNENNIIKIRELASELKGSSSIFLLGKGRSQAIAMECALKLKEVAYIHSEGYSSSALKHGTFALIVPNLPIIIFDIDEEYHSKNQNAVQEVLAREAKVILISDNDNSHLKIEKNQTFGGLIANVYLQLLSYYIAMELGHNPDYPKNLAKVVTVL
uniref:Glutamine--fructose-6-phosphate aminotransferase [isomerizing] n=1 Tax=viral metagenome TaxID=1070528 RepID=A0A6C0JNE7_9ZZZZ